MKGLEALLDATYDRNGCIGIRFIDNDLLEAPRERLILLYVLHILVRGGRSEHLELTAGQLWLEDVGGIHTATSAHEKVHLIYEEHDVGVRLRILHDGLESFLELPMLRGSGHECRHVKGPHPETGQFLRNIAPDYPVRKALGNSSLSSTRRPH